MSKILVTGGSGFIGSYVCRELEAKGYEPVVLDRHMQKANPWRRYDSVFGDVRDRVVVDAAVGACEGVIHLAGQLGTQETVRHPHTAAETNVLGTLNVLSAAHAYGVPMVNISVGNWWMNNPYSISKNCAERFCLMFRKELGAKVSVVRALNAYGPGQKTEPVRKIVPTFITACLEGRPIEVYGDGEQVMDLIHVRDVARVLVRALEILPEQIVEAGSGQDTTVNDIARAVIRATGGYGGIEHVPMRPGEESNSVVLGDPTTLDVLGLNVDDDFTTLEDGLCETVEHYRSSTSSGVLAA